ncbi:MAG: hypothetical protein Q9157_001429 [Trypethelium eluteriae]
MCEDAGLAYKDVRYSFDEFPSFKREQLTDLNPLGSLPLVLLNDKILTQSYAILRHFARQLGAYEGETEEEKYWTDVICDIVIDWRTKFVDAYFSDGREQTYGDYCRNTRPVFLKGLERHLESHSTSTSGSFVLGQKISYADLVLYQICHDDQLTQDGRAGLKEYPRLSQLVDAVENRPNVKEFLASDRYLG